MVKLAKEFFQHAVNFLVYSLPLKFFGDNYEIQISIKVKLSIKKFFKKLVLWYTKLGKPFYPYIVEPIQFEIFINLFEELKVKEC